MIALLSNQCGPNAYCTPEARDTIINEMFANIDAVVKAILANTCTAAKCDESIFVETDPLSLTLYQKFCAAGGECTVEEMMLDLCVVAICNRPDTSSTADETATPPEEKPQPACKGDDEQCKKDRLGAAQDAPPDPLNIIIPVLTGLPEYLESARQCAAIEICVGLVAYVQAALNFQLTHGTDEGMPLSDLLTPAPRPGSPGGESINVGTLPDPSKTDR